MPMPVSMTAISWLMDLQAARRFTFAARLGELDGVIEELQNHPGNFSSSPSTWAGLARTPESA
jgi:hypothetical protein